MQLRKESLHAEEMGFLSHQEKLEFSVVELVHDLLHLLSVGELRNESALVVVAPGQPRLLEEVLQLHELCVAVHEHDGLVFNSCLQ